MQSISRVRNCLECGSEFRLPRLTKPKDYCSRKCSGQAKWKRTRERRTCIRCGSEFWFLPSAAGLKRPTRGQYCSRACCDADGRVTIECAKCGKPFTRIKAIPRKYCSLECAGRTKNRVTKECVICGTVFELCAAHAAKAKCCSNQCRGKYTAELRKRTNEEKRARLQTKEWSRVRKVVLARDEHKCVCCNQSYVRLCIHHIIPWRISKSDSPDNLVALCFRCHALVERGELSLPLPP